MNVSTAQQPAQQPYYGGQQPQQPQQPQPSHAQPHSPKQQITILSYISLVFVF